jgi:hypothetical protein
MKSKRDEYAEEYADAAFRHLSNVPKDKAAYGKAYDTIMVYEAEVYVEQAYIAGYNAAIEEALRALRDKHEAEITRLRKDLAVATEALEFVLTNTWTDHAGTVRPTADAQVAREALARLKRESEGEK